MVSQRADGRANTRGLLLDLDDTLYDRGAAFRSWAEEVACIQLGHPLDPDQLTALIAIDRRGHRPREEFAAEALLLGLHVDAESFPFQLTEHVVAEPGVLDTIEALAQNRRIAIVTNGGAAQRAKVARIGLERVVHAVFVSSEVGVAKPDPAIFDRALQWCELAATEVMFVGDHPIVDLAPAAALGMATTWRVRGEWPESLEPPTYRITNIRELREVCA